MEKLTLILPLSEEVKEYEDENEAVCVHAYVCIHVCVHLCVNICVYVCMMCV